MTQKNDQNVSDGVYDSPIILPGEVSIEPQRYVAEQPYDLTRYEYNFLKRSSSANFWSNLFAGASAGIGISITGKSIIALLDQQRPDLELWEVAGFCVGIVLTLLFKFFIKTEDDLKKQDLIKIVDNHFNSCKPRRIHLTGQDRNDEA